MKQGSLPVVQKLDISVIHPRISFLLAKLDSGDAYSAGVALNSLIFDLAQVVQGTSSELGAVSSATMKRVKRSLRTAGLEAAAHGLRKAMGMAVGDLKPAIPKDET